MSVFKEAEDLYHMAGGPGSVRPNPFSVRFFKYNTNEGLESFGTPLRAGDVIEAVEFNHDTQLYDVLVK